MALDGLISRNSKQLIECGDLNPAILLHALAEVESNHGARGTATLHEAAYCYKGFYYSAPSGEDLRRLSASFGCLAHCSYSSWQILYISAYEEGFRGDPTELRDDFAAIPYVIRFINRRILNRYPRLSVEGFADAWNSGDPTDSNIPSTYIERFKAAYEKWSTLLK